MPSFGKKSLEQRETLDPRLQKLMDAAIIHVDFSILEGFRSVERQRKLFEQGMSKADGTIRVSKHNFMPSLAVDILPFPSMLHGKNIWTDEHRFRYFSGIIRGIAFTLGIPVVWGGDWDGDLSKSNQTFHDLPHWELRD